MRPGKEGFDPGKEGFDGWIKMGRAFVPGEACGASNGRAPGAGPHAGPAAMVAMAPGNCAGPRNPFAQDDARRLFGTADYSSYSWQSVCRGHGPVTGRQLPGLVPAFGQGAGAGVGANSVKGGGLDPDEAWGAPDWVTGAAPSDGAAACWLGDDDGDGDDYPPLPGLALGASGLLPVVVAAWSRGATMPVHAKGGGLDPDADPDDAWGAPDWDMGAAPSDGAAACWLGDDDGDGDDYPPLPGLALGASGLLPVVVAAWSRGATMPVHAKGGGLDPDADPDDAWGAPDWDMGAAPSDGAAACWLGDDDGGVDDTPPLPGLAFGAPGPLPVVVAAWARGATMPVQAPACFVQFVDRNDIIWLGDDLGMEEDSGEDDNNDDDDDDDDDDDMVTGTNKNGFVEDTQLSAELVPVLVPVPCWV